MTILAERIEVVEERTDRLETLFGQFMTQTGISIRRHDRLIERMENMIAEMKEESARDRATSAMEREEMDRRLKGMIAEMKEESARDRAASAMEREEMDRRLKGMIAEMKEESARDRAASAMEREEMDRRLKGMIAEMKEESARDRAASAMEREEMDRRLEGMIAEMKEESARDRREMNKRWGELANKMGTIVEDIIAPSLRRMALEEFNCGEEVFFSPRVSRIRSDDPSRQREFDVLYVGARAVLLNETKSAPRSEYIQAFVDFLRRGEFALYFPEYQEMPIVPVFSSLHIPGNLVTHLTRNGIYAVAMGEEAMRVLNLDTVRQQG